MAEIFESGHFYHIYNRGNNKENIFVIEDNYRYFFNLIKKYILSIAEIYSYCLLKNHFHFLLRIKDFEHLPEKYRKDITKLHQPFSNLFAAYAKGFNKQTGRTGSLFQENMHKIRVTDLSYLQHLIAYIHLNPTKHGFTDDFRDYKFSSYQSILSDNPTKLKRIDVIYLFDDKENFVYWHDSKKIKHDGIMEEIENLDI
jgi:REP element-mobilizing transposase RayT